MRRSVPAALAVVALLLGAGGVAYRVLAPAEVLDAAAGPPPARATGQPGALSRFPATPLIVDGRLRVYATTRQVRADAPVSAPTQRTPFWSYRRWPAQVSGVVATGPTVVTRWSDGALVALDAPTGEIRWRADGPPATGYAGRRTGAQTVYAPPGLHTAGSSVLVSGGGQLIALDVATGRLRWEVAACRSAGYTTAGGQFGCVDGGEAYDVRTGRPVEGWPAGAAEPLGCGPAASGCTAVRTTDAAGRTRGWRLSGPAPVATPTLDTPGSWLSGDLVIAPAGAPGPSAAGADPAGADAEPAGPASGPATGGPASDGASGAPASGGPAPSGPAAGFVARSVRTGAEVWRWRAPSADPADAARLLAVQPDRVHLLSGRSELVTLDPATGVERWRFTLAYRRDRVTGWVPGHVHARDGFVVVERLRDQPDPTTTDDDAYYFALETVIMAAT